MTPQERLEQAKRDRDRRKKHLLNINQTRPEPKFFPLDPDGPASVIQRDPNRGTNRINTPDGGTAQTPQINNSSITNPVDYDSESNTTDQRPHTPTVPIEEITPPGAELPYIKILFGVFDPETEVMDFYVGGDRQRPTPILTRTNWKGLLPKGQYDNAQTTLQNVGAHLDSWGQDQSEWIASIGSVFDVVRPPLPPERLGAVESVAIHDVIQGVIPDGEAGQPFNASIQIALAGREGIPKDAPDGVTDEIEHKLTAYPQGWAEYRYNAKSGEDDPCCVGYHYDWVNGKPDLNRPFDRRPGWVAKLTGRNLNKGVIQVWVSSEGSTGRNFTMFADKETCSSGYGEPLITNSMQCSCEPGGVVGIKGTVSERRFNQLGGSKPKDFCAGFFGAEKNTGFSVTAYAAIYNERNRFAPVLNLPGGATAIPMIADVWWKPALTVAENPAFNPYAITGSIRAYRTTDPVALTNYFNSIGYSTGGGFEGFGVVGTGIDERCANFGLESALVPPPPPPDQLPGIRDQCKIPNNGSFSQFVRYRKAAEVYMRDIENGLFCGATWQGKTVNMCNSPIIPETETWCADPHFVAKPLTPNTPYPLSLPRDKDKKPVWKPELIPLLKSGYGLPDTTDYDTRISFPYRGLWEITSMEFVWCGEPNVDKFLEGWQDGQTVYAAPPEENPRPLHLPFAQSATHENPWFVVTSNPEIDRSLMKRGNDYGLVLGKGQPVTLVLGDGVKALLDANPLGISWERGSDRLWVVEVATFANPDWAKSDEQTTVSVTGLLLDVVGLTLDIEGQITALAIGPAMTDDQSIFSYSFHPTGLNG